ncbi:hypothetical protein SCHPADRAFT_349891 [Schizopora paradoxa]|uniref:Uncharacterized protein n=1 Tax=Schizopora paradoxa TaxID=27342 RepID=A0A0H2SA23_9AGAM|nr:hypothetical protein SCHPADRAFT_349891 [Schizopora paradoxa]
MVFRLPTPFDPMSSDSSRNAQSRPWRGTFSLHGISLFPPRDASGQQLLFATSAETEGDNRVELWPKHFNIYVTRQTCRLSDIQAYIRTNPQPLCMFMPDRHGGSQNEANFRTLARTMTENQMIAIAPWNDPERLPGAGILLFPTTSSTALLVGVIFLNSPFPDFLSDPLRQNASAIPTGLPASTPGPFSSSQMFPSSTSSPSSYTSAGPPITPPSRVPGYHVNELLKAMGGIGGGSGSGTGSVSRPMSPFGFNGDRAAAARYRASQSMNWPIIEDNNAGPQANWQ